MVWAWNLYKNYSWWNIFIRDTSPRVAQEQKFSIKEKLSWLWFITTTVATLASSKCNTYALVFGYLIKGNSKNKILSFWNQSFIKNLQKGGKLNGIVLKNITQKDMVTDEVELSNDVFQAWLRTHRSFFIDKVNTWGKQKIHNHC